MVANRGGAGLHKTPSAINHLVNPYHPNKPAKGTLLLLKLLMARERPNLVKGRTCELNKAPREAKPNATRLSPRERKMIEDLRQLSSGEREKVHAVMKALLRATGRKGRKSRQ